MSEEEKEYLKSLSSTLQEEEQGLKEELVASITAWLLLINNISVEDVRDTIYKTFPYVIAPFQIQAIQRSYLYLMEASAFQGGEFIPNLSEKEVSDIRKYTAKTGVVTSNIMSALNKGEEITSLTDSVASIASNSINETSRAVVQTVASKEDEYYTIWHAEGGEACTWCWEMDGIVTNQINSHDNCRCTLLMVKK